MTNIVKDVTTIAHRLARNVFGRTCRCLSFNCVDPNREPRKAGLYQAVIGSGPKTDVELLVHVENYR